MVGTINAFNIKPIENKTDKKSSISIASELEQKNDKSMTFKVKKQQMDLLIKPEDHMNIN